MPESVTSYNACLLTVEDVFFDNEKLNIIADRVACKIFDRLKDFSCKSGNRIFDEKITSLFVKKLSEFASLELLYNSSLKNEIISFPLTKFEEKTKKIKAVGILDNTLDSLKVNAFTLPLDYSITVKIIDYKGSLFRIDENYKINAKL